MPRESPLFAVETVRSLSDQRVVERDGSAYRLVGDLGTLTVPDCLHALLVARLDALPPEVRTLVADVNVLGTSFPKEALVAVSGRDDETMPRVLAQLVRRDVFHVLADTLSPLLPSWIAPQTRREPAQAVRDESKR